MQEKRRHPRKEVSLAAELLLEGESVRVEGRCQDLSIGGSYVVTAARAPFGTKISLWIQMAGAVIEVAGIVRWNGVDGVGVQFGSMGAKATHEITQAIRVIR